MAYTTIDDPTNYFDIVTYTGDGGSSKTITGLGFVADFLWIKNRDSARSHILGNRLFSPPIIGAYAADGGSTDTTINLSVTADVFSYIVFNEAIKAGYDGKGLVTINLTVSNNAKIGTVRSTVPALDFRGFPTNCVLGCTINSGSAVYGGGGAGGNGGGYGSVAGGGEAGGDSLWVDKAITIVNNGTFAGGGGGGGGGAGWAPTGMYGMGGAGAGAGQGYTAGFGGSNSGSSANVSAASNGGDASISSAGSGGGGSSKDGYTTHSGAAGGAFGAAGGGSTGSHTSWAGQGSSGGAGGAGGKYADGGSVITWSTAGTRTGSANNSVTNGVGILPYLSSERTDFLTYQTDVCTEINSSGFKVGADNVVNEDGDKIVAWAWGDASTGTKGATLAVNTTGSINSRIKPNTDSKFSYGTYEGTGSAATIGHGLGVVPELILIKMINTQPTSGFDWTVYHKDNTSSPETDYLVLNSNAATADNTFFNDTAPTNAVFSIGTADVVNKDDRHYQFYAFASVKGFSKMGTYTGNANTNGTFVNLGFKPSWILVKKNSGQEGWQIVDNKRSPFNEMDERLVPNSSADEETGQGGGDRIDFVSNGFKCRDGAGQYNDANTYVYLAFAEHPFVSSEGVPVTAK